MKKYLFMCLAMFCMAFTTVALTSCGSDDDTEIGNLNGTATVEIYDPMNELTAAQKSELQQMINKVGALRVTNATESQFEQEFKKWGVDVAYAMTQFQLKYPEVEQSQAGLKMKANGFTIPGGGILPFKPEKE